jgi:hypothetical protein
VMDPAIVARHGFGYVALERPGEAL